ncbi:MAG TPA: hypothetical protein VIJ14_10955, partial [Rhabdochlamydiaceae bacterium]
MAKTNAQDELNDDLRDFRQSLERRLSSRESFNFFMQHTSLLTAIPGMQKVEKKWVSGISKILLEHYWQKDDLDTDLLLCYIIGLYDAAYVRAQLREAQDTWATSIAKTQEYLNILEKNEKTNSFIRKNLKLLEDAYRVARHMASLVHSKKTLTNEGADARGVQQQLTRLSASYLALQDYYIAMHNMSLEHVNSIIKATETNVDPATLQEVLFKPLLLFVIPKFILPGSETIQKFLKTHPFPIPSHEEPAKPYKRKERKKKQDKPSPACPSEAKEKEKITEESPEPIIPESAKAPDKSFVISEEKGEVVIEDPHNNTVITLFTTDIKKPVTVKLPLKYSPNVKEWS